MYGILRRYDGQRTPDWGATINLSTLVAVIATLIRALLVFVVAEIIGQAKWDYFAGNGRHTDDTPMRRLIQTSRFNDASQGSIGAVRLLPTICRDPATLLAVMIMILSMGTGPFAQQAIQTQSCQLPVDGAKAFLPIARNITAGRGGLFSVFSPLDKPNVHAALQSALAPDNEEIGSPISMGCPTGNCTFQNIIGGLYSTLGFCSSCVDTSPLITSTGWTLIRQEDELRLGDEAFQIIGEPTFYRASYILPDGTLAKASLSNMTMPYSQGAEMLASPTQVMGLDWAGDLVSPEMMALSQAALANVTILSPTWLPTNSGYTDYVAASCTLYPCLRSYNARVTSGKLDEILVSKVPAVTNVATRFTPNATTEAVQQWVYGNATTEAIQQWIYGNTSVKNDDYGIYSSDLGAVKSPCLVNGTVWTKADQSSSFNMQRVILLHPELESNTAPSVKIENIKAPAECIYGMNLPAMADFSAYMVGALFDGNCSATWEIDSPENTTRMECGEPDWLARFYNKEGTTVDSIIKRIEAFTDRLSNKLRMGLFNNPEAVYGQVLQATVCSKIQYSWLTFPAVLVAVTSGLLAWTMFQSLRRRGCEMVWKTSILPFLFYGDRFIVQNGEDMSPYSSEAAQRDGPRGPLLDLEQMENDAKQQVVQFDVFK